MEGCFLSQKNCWQMRFLIMVANHWMPCKTLYAKSNENNFQWVSTKNLFSHSKQNFKCSSVLSITKWSSILCAYFNTTLSFSSTNSDWQLKKDVKEKKFIKVWPVYSQHFHSFGLWQIENDVTKLDFWIKCQYWHSFASPLIYR